MRLRDLFFALIVFILVFNLCFTLTITKGISMNPSFQTGDLILTANLFNDPIERNDFILIKDDHLEYPIVKRVVGLPGDKVLITNEGLFINDELIESEYGDKMYTPGLRYLNDNEYFYIGDNFQNSYDSTHQVLGTVHKSNIVSNRIYRLIRLKKLIDMFELLDLTVVPEE